MLRRTLVMGSALAALTRVAGADPAPTTAAAPATAPEARVAAEQACAAHAPDCDWITTLGSLEQLSTRRALAARGLVPDPAPWGKVIEEVHVYNEDVFVEGWSVLRWLNHFHVTTKEHAIIGELVIGKGELWDQARVEESARRLRDPTYTSVVAIIPVRAHDPGKTALLVVTRDIFSLRFNTTYTYQQGSLTNLNISFSENNFLGQRNTIAAAVTMDQGAIAVGPLFVDKNVAGTHASLSARVDDILTRRALIDGDPRGLEDAHALHSEGTDSNISLTMPLWSLASEWGWGTTFTHSWSVQRQFFGTHLRGYDDPDTAAQETLPWQYGLHAWTANAYVVRQLGHYWKHQISFGHTVSSTHPYLLANFTDDPTLRDAFERDVFPRTEVISSPYLEYAVFEPRYKTLHDIATYDLGEDVRFGPSLDVTYSQGLTFLGSDHTFERLAGTAQLTLGLARDGYVNGAVTYGGRYLGGSWIDNTLSTSVRIVSPSRWHGRVVLQSALATRWNDTQNAFYTLGSDSGLRGFLINEFIGQRRLLNQLEVRTAPWKLWVLRVGGVAFYENGGAAESLRTMHVVHDAGVGLRWLIPQTSRSLFRFDVAVPLDGTEPGTLHFIAGFDSYF